MKLRRAILSPDGRFVGARSPLAILRTFFPFAPLRVYAFLVIVSLAGSALLVVLLRQLVSDRAAWQWGLSGGLIGGFVVTMIAAVELCHRLADCKFEIQNDILQIRAPTTTRILTAEWPLDMIQEFVLECRPTILEDLANEQLVTPIPALLVGGSEFLGSSQRPERLLRVRTIDGALTEFCLINRVFDLAAVNAIVNELARRGVKISRLTNDLE